MQNGSDALTHPLPWHPGQDGRAHEEVCEHIRTLCAYPEPALRRPNTECKVLWSLLGSSLCSVGQVGWQYLIRFISNASHLHHISYELILAVDHAHA